MIKKKCNEAERAEYDYYATDPKAAVALMEVESLNNVWECANGGGHLSSVLNPTKKSDIVDRTGDTEIIDFLSVDDSFAWNGDIVTNPPYKYSQAFLEKALKIVSNGNKVCLFLPIQFLESKRRKELLEEYPPRNIYVFSSRIKCGKNGVFAKESSTACYAWFVWEKGIKRDMVIKLI